MREVLQHHGCGKHLFASSWPLTCLDTQASRWDLGLRGSSVLVTRAISSFAWYVVSPQLLDPIACHGVEVGAIFAE